MKILSLDVGIKNLSFCYINDNLEIIDWQNVSIIESNVKNTKIDEITLLLLERLQELFDNDYEADVVLIENQPTLINGLMKTISVIIYTYFNLLKLQFGNIKQVRFISATNKLKCKKISELDMPKKTSYKDRKLYSIKLTTLYLQEISPNKLEWLKSNKKIDDLCDSFLQSIYYIENTSSFQTI
jgi:hypothetical protein